MKTAILVLLVILACWATCYGQQGDFRVFVGEAAANVGLPPNVDAPFGAVSLWADFDKAEKVNQGIPLYLVNKTLSAVTFESQDGDIYIKLETQNESGTWVRAQTHQYSDCGNSYGFRTLQPGMHFRFLGYRPFNGREARVRYSMQSGQALVSNIGVGLVSEADIEAARFDGMSLRSVPRTLRNAFDPEWRRKDISPSQSVECLTLLQAYGSVPALKREAELQLQKWRAQSAGTQAEKDAALAFERILASQWPEDISADRLLRFCFDQLTGKPATKTISSSLTWSALGELAIASFGSTHGRHSLPLLGKSSDEWKSVTQWAAANIASSAREEAVGMSQVLSVTFLTDTFLSTDTLETVLKGDPHLASKVAAYALSRRGSTERLSELAMSLPPENQPMVLAALASGGVSYEQTGLDGWGGLRQPETGTKEEAFWKHVMGTQPIQASDALRYLSPHDLGPDAFGPIVLGGLCSFWTKEIERSNAAGADFALPSPHYSYRLSVDFLARSKRKDHASIFRALLGYRGYEPQEGVRSDNGSGTMVPYVKQWFGVRHASIEALKALGERIPSDVVLERDVSDPTRITEKTNGDP